MGLPTSAQHYSNLRNKTLWVQDSIVLDSLSMVPQSEILRDTQNHIIADSLYYISYSRSTLYLKKPQSLRMTYRVFPYNFSKPYPEFPPRANDSLPLYYNPYASGYLNNADAAGSESGLLVNGNISRGISVGNAQNMTLNSNLNLQLSGELSDGLFIEANLSDKNIPVQPDGYSQQIREFDQVYIRIYDSLRSLKMGDVEISAQNSHFMRFNRRILGGDFKQQAIPVSEQVKGSAQVSAAVSKGNFNRSEFIGIEAVQGPYKLQGAKNETFIVILAGTEKVYLDGLLLERGENADYVINYNTAELTFTPRHFITKDSRIITEFEYADKNYNRFLFYTQNQVTYKNQSYAVQYFTEGDAKNQPVNQLLTDEYRQIIADAGNDPLKAMVPNFDSVAFDKNRVLYKLTDTTVNGRLYDSILVYSNHPDSAFYEAGFALVGENKGNYVQQITPANGKVFTWIAPINERPQGNYEPVQILAAPQKQHMVVAKTEIALTDRTRISVEWAFAEKNSNTFSDQASTLSRGWAMKNYVEHRVPLDKKTIMLSLAYEWAKKNFIPIERYKNAEFKRDWNIYHPMLSDEHFISAELALLKKKQSQVAIISEYLNYGSLYQGFRNTAHANLTFAKFNLSTKATLLNSDALESTTLFYRHHVKLTRPVWKVKLGLRHEFENNIQTVLATDSLSALSRKYSLAEAFITQSDSSNNAFYLGYKNRVDFLPLQNTLSPVTETNDIVFNNQWNSAKQQLLKTSLIWRNLKVREAVPQLTAKNEQNLLGQIDHQLKLKNNLLSFFTFYEIGTGLESRKEYSYIEVATGQGIYVWVDYNSNGIPELSEFEISPFPEEANYLRIYTPSKEYIKVYSLKFNETLKIDPSRIWRNQQGLKSFLARFSNTTAFRASQKHTQNDLLSRINPFPAYVHDSAQMTRNLSLRNTFSFNRRNPAFGADYTYSLQNQKNLISNGFDASASEMHQVKIRWNVTTALTLLNQSEWQSRSYDSEYFTQKNHEIESLADELTLQWQPTPKFRTALIYKVKNKVNHLGTESALLQEAGPEIKINSPKQGIISFKVSLIVNAYEGALNAPVAYTMLEGYQPGENYRWSINFSRNINKFLRINLNYNGRKPAESAVIHTGQFSVSAYF